MLDSGTATLPFVFRPKGDLARQPDIGNAPESAIVAAITPDVFRPDGNLNPREIPISLQLPDWNHWLPRVHPLDAWGVTFENSEFARLYGPIDGSSSAVRRVPSSGSKQTLREAFASPDLSAVIASGR